MNLRPLLVMLALCSCFTSTLFAGCGRGDRLIGEVGFGLECSDFYALMPTDNSTTVAVNSAVLFPEDGPSTGSIVRLNTSSFLLPAMGIYLVQFQVSVTEAGQLMLRLNNADVENSVVGRATGTSQIVGVSLINTTIPNSVLEVINPPGNASALTITSLAGGTHPVSAHLVIIRLF